MTVRRLGITVRRLGMAVRRPLTLRLGRRENYKGPLRFTRASGMAIRRLGMAVRRLGMTIKAFGMAITAPEVTVKALR
jgi:hypothetical protein